jgi:hypothetical protein
VVGEFIGDQKETQAFRKDQIALAFPQAVPTLAVNQHTAIPRTDADTQNPRFLDLGSPKNEKNINL